MCCMIWKIIVSRSVSEIQGYLDLFFVSIPSCHDTILVTHNHLLSLITSNRDIRCSCNVMLCSSISEQWWGITCISIVVLLLPKKLHHYALVFCHNPMWLNWLQLSVYKHTRVGLEVNTILGNVMGSWNSKSIKQWCSNSSCRLGDDHECNTGPDFEPK